MRYFLSLCLLLLFVPAQSQLKELFQDKRADLDNWQIEGADREGLIRLAKNSGEIPDYLYLQDDNFTVIDFDRDGLYDLAYFGHAGGESKIFMLLRNSGDGIESTTLQYGELVYLSSPGNLEPLSFGIRTLACCSDYRDFYEYFVPTRNGIGDFGYKSVYHLVFRSETTFPQGQLFEQPIAFETVNPTYTLRYSPLIDNEGQATLEHQEIVGNQVAVYSPGARGTAYAKSTDETGRVWYLVFMHPDTPPADEIFFFNDNETPYRVGWMSSRFIKEMQ